MSDTAALQQEIERLRDELDICRNQEKANQVLLAKLATAAPSVDNVGPNECCGDISLPPSMDAAACHELELFCHSVCPFAHRAWLALAEKEVPYTYTHIALGAEKPASYLEINPAGTVPSLRCGDKIIVESMWCAEFVDDRFPDRGPRLLPTEPHRRYDCKVLLDWFGKNIIPFSYRLLKNQDPTKDEELATELTKHVHEFNRRMTAASPTGPYYFGEDFTIADLATCTFFDRFRHTLKHYRGYNTLPETCPRLLQWMAAIDARPAMKKTSQPGEFYIEKYVGYAGERGVSELGK
eukprot:CAMPEP_0175962636 /NCGR_PEP_ID=MMETSP0108-20121206/36584_1 /TAXON_ID=195067 ORGANISM="Goniomonas pacifica, Strain CCMP1869" /NCGR_SAMPLE_ID=MMETSP0108 /ASSEMBLY_ACC=CAM_ASM_000204 /LENGTH=294 /DNA_ID=CAMNT_0017290465 /DNA_START=9 /DNA_END=893 /DNA_ORIENTATION=-